MPDIWPNLPLEHSKNENLVWKLHFLIVQEVNLAEYPAVKPNLRLLPDAWQQPDLMIFGRRTSGRRIGRIVSRRFCRRKIRFNTAQNTSQRATKLEIDPLYLLIPVKERTVQPSRFAPSRGLALLGDRSVCRILI